LDVFSLFESLFDESSFLAGSLVLDEVDDLESVE
jgi:hypothetical protein